MQLRAAALGTEQDNTELTIPGPEHREIFAQLAAQGVLPGENIELHFVPVHDLQRGRATTFFCTPVFCIDDAVLIEGYRAFQRIGQRDLPFVDRALLAHAVKFARKLAASGTVAAIGTSVNFGTLSWPRGKEIYEQALQAAGVADCPFFILKIEDVPSGVPAAKLGEIVATLQPHVKRIFAHLPDTMTPIHQHGYLGLSGLVLSLPPRPTQAVVNGTAKWLLKECEAQTAHACVDRIDNHETLEMIKEAGIRYAVGQALGTRDFRGVDPPDLVERFMNKVAASWQATGKIQLRPRSL